MSADEDKDMSTEDPTSAAHAYRQIPPVDRLVDSPVLGDWLNKLPRTLVVEAAQEILQEHRAQLAPGAGPADAPSREQFAGRVAERLESWQQPLLGAVINATGIIVHTGLGRSPLPESAVAALVEVARHYAPVELDLPSGQRSKRSQIVRDLLCRLTGAESATVVNNNAAALLLILSTFASGREVIVSRGELIEIGGSFRLPDVMAAGGAILREVGTTNKTRLSDYQQAIGESTAALLKVHTSNYRVEGFTESVAIAELADLGHRHGLVVIDDIGSGALHDLGNHGLLGEPAARSSIDGGADLVLFSGDKLLGGPQAGIIVGRKSLVDRIERHPMMRALRVDKLILAALGATLPLHRSPALASQKVPVLAMLTAPLSNLQKRARHLANRLESLAGMGQVKVMDTTAYLGGGSLPTQGVPSIALRIHGPNIREQELAARLRTGNPSVVTRVQDGAVWIDLRTVFEQQDNDLCAAILAAIT